MRVIPESFTYKIKSESAGMLIIQANIAHMHDQ